MSIFKEIIAKPSQGWKRRRALEGIWAVANHSALAFEAIIP